MNIGAWGDITNITTFFHVNFTYAAFFLTPAHKAENEGEVRLPHTRFRIRQAKKAASDLDVDSTANTQRTAAVMFSCAGA